MYTKIKIVKAESSSLLDTCALCIFHPIYCPAVMHDTSITCNTEEAEYFAFDTELEYNDDGINN